MATNRPYRENYVQINSITEGDRRQQVEVEHESDLCLGYIYIHSVPEICYEILVNYVTVNSSRHSKGPPKKSGKTMKSSKPTLGTLS